MPSSSSRRQGPLGFLIPFILGTCRRHAQAWRHLAEKQRWFIILWSAGLLALTLGAFAGIQWGFVPAQRRVTVPVELRSSASRFSGRTSCPQCHHPFHFQGGCQEGTRQGGQACSCTGGPLKVTLGTWLNAVRDFSLENGSWVADLWVWASWEGSGQFSPDELDFPNAEILWVQPEAESPARLNRDGQHYWVRKYLLKISHQINPWKFPTDEHRLKIAIEADEDAREVCFADTFADVGHASNLRIPGYTLSRAWADEGEFVYPTHFGEPGGDESSSTYVRYEYNIAIARSGLGLFFKTHTVLFASILVAFLTFFVTPSRVDPRFGLAGAAFFAAAANTYVVHAMLPKDGTLCISDLVNIAGMAIIFLVTLQTTIVHRYQERIANHMAFTRCYDLATLACLSLAVLLLEILVPWIN